MTAILKQKLPLTTKEKTFLEDMNVFYLRSRYPDLRQPPLPDPTKMTTAIYLEKTKKILLWLEQQ